MRFLEKYNRSSIFQIKKFYDPSFYKFQEFQQNFRRIFHRNIVQDFATKILKGVFAKNERGYRLNAIKKPF